MGLIAKVLEFARTARNGAKVSDVKADPGGGDLQTSEHFQDANTDSVPLPDDYELLVKTQGTGRHSVAGYVDPKSAQASQPGEWRAYARGPESGEQVAQVWVMNDGAVLTENASGSHMLFPGGAQTMQNAGGYIKLLEDGTVDINGYIIDKDGNGTTKSGISQDEHEHTGNLGSPTSPPIP